MLATADWEPRGLASVKRFLGGPAAWGVLVGLEVDSVLGTGAGLRRDEVDPRVGMERGVMALLDVLDLTGVSDWFAAGPALDGAM